MSQQAEWQAACLPVSQLLEFLCRLQCYNPGLFTSQRSAVLLACKATSQMTVVSNSTAGAMVTIIYPNLTIQVPSGYCKFTLPPNPPQRAACPGPSDGLHSAASGRAQP